MIIVEQKGQAMIFSLQEAEAHLEAAKGTIIVDPVSQEKSKPRKGRVTKKTEKVLSPSKQ